MSAKPTPARRLTHYRKLAARCGVPPQFLDDAVQAIDAKVRLEPSERAAYWRRTARFEAINQMRFWRGVHGDREPNEPPVSLDGLTGLLPAGEDDRYDPLDEQDKRRAVHELMGVLPLREHCILQLRLDGWKYMQIAELFEMTESRAVKVEKQALRRLRKALGSTVAEAEPK